MFKIIFVFFYVFIFLHNVFTWDLAVSTPEEIELLSKTGELSVTIGGQLDDIVSMTYDYFNGHIYVSDRLHAKYSVLRILAPGYSDNPASKLEPVVLNEGGSINAMAFDSIRSILFWTTYRTISYMPIPQRDEEEGGGASSSSSMLSAPPSVVPQAGTVLHNFTEELPYAIVVDSCRSLIFWTNGDRNHATIERSNYDGFDKVVVYAPDQAPIALTVDLTRRTLYWVTQQDETRIETADYDGRNFRRLAQFNDGSGSIVSLSIGFDSLYFLNRTSRSTVLSEMDLSSGGGGEIRRVNTKEWKYAPTWVMTSDEKYLVFNNSDQCMLRARPTRIIPTSNTYADDQVTILPDGVKYVKEVLVDERGHVTMPMHANCSGNGVLLTHTATCLCKEGFHGEQCEKHLACVNYCMRGATCEVNVNGLPMCSCPRQFSGARCEVDICENKCLNGGTCAFISTNQTHCECAPGYYGAHCEENELMCEAFCLYRNDLDRGNRGMPEPNNCRCEKFKDLLSSSQKSSNPVNDLFSGKESLPIISHEADDVRSGSNSMSIIVTILGGLVTLLSGFACFLMYKVRLLSKRPRIKKRFVVSKTTPLTARPPQSDQCEITIENCCNMNICETPCFEPEFRTPIVKSNNKKSTSDDKRQLLDSTEDGYGGFSSS